MANKKTTKKKSTKKPTYIKKGSNQKNKRGMLLAIAITVVVIAALAIVLTIVFGGKNKGINKALLKNNGKHITVTGEQRLLQLCDKIESGIAYTEIYETEGMTNYFTGDGTKDYVRVTFATSDYNWDVSELYDGTDGYAIDYTNSTASKFTATYEDIQKMSMIAIYIGLRDADNLKFIESGEETFEGENCYYETYAQTSSYSGDNTIKAYFYKDTLVAVVTENSYKTSTEYIELLEGADDSYLTYTKPEGITESF